MSLRWLDRLDAVLAPTAVVGTARPWRLGAAGEPPATTLRCAPATEGPAWGPAVQALQGWLAGQSLRGARVRIALSDHFTRYALLPWHPELTGRAEREGLAHHLFETRFGELAQGWSVHLARGGYGQAALACAVDKGLLEALQTTCNELGLRLSSVRSLLALAADGFAQRFGRDAGLLVLEPGRLSGLAWQQGAWQAVHSMRLGSGRWDSAWVARHADLMGMDRSSPLYLAVADPSAGPQGSHGASAASAALAADAASAPFVVLNERARGTAGALWSLASGAPA